MKTYAQCYNIPDGQSGWSHDVVVLDKHIQLMMKFLINLFKYFNATFCVSCLMDYNIRFATIKYSNLN